MRPEKPIIKVLETGESVEGYLGPYQIGTSLSLVCQVNGGKLLFFNKIRNHISYLPSIVEISQSKFIISTLIYDLMLYTVNNRFYK